MQIPDFLNRLSGNDMTILAIDVGNTRAKLGIWRGANPSGHAADFLTAVPLASDVNLPHVVKSWLTRIDCHHVDQVVIAGSNPQPVDELIDSWVSRQFPVSVIRSHEQVCLKMGVQNPDTVGIDRLLTAVAVRAGQKIFTPVIVVDAGTATTVNLTTADGTFQGGAILPGMRMSARALHDYTAVLPLIDADALVGAEGGDATITGSAEQLPSVQLQMPGTDTTAAIQNGIFWGHLGSIKELIAQLINQLQASNVDTSDPTIAVTGGGGRQLARLIPNATYEDSLALTGLSTLAGSDDIAQ